MLLAWERDAGSTAIGSEGSGAVSVVVERSDEYALTKLPAYGEVRQVGDAHALFGHKDYWLKFFRIGVYEPERVAAAREGEGPGNHSPLFAPVPKPTIETGVEAMTLAVLSVFDQHARENAREK